MGRDRSLQSHETAGPVVWAESSLQEVQVPTRVFLWEGRWQLGAASKVGAPTFPFHPSRLLECLP